MPLHKVESCFTGTGFLRVRVLAPYYITACTVHKVGRSEEGVAAEKFPGGPKINDNNVVDHWWRGFSFSAELIFAGGDS